MTRGNIRRAPGGAVATAARPSHPQPVEAPAANKDVGPDGLHILAYGALAAGVILALLASQDTKPLLLTALAVLSMFGAFFLFGIAAGHVRIGERVSERELLRALLEGLTDGVSVTDRDGTQLYANRMYGEVLGEEDASTSGSIEMSFQGQPEPQQAVYRLLRAASRGEPWREDITSLGPLKHQVRRLRISHKPFQIPGRERDFGPLVLWTICDVTIEHDHAFRQVQSLEAAIAAYDQAPVGLVSIAPDGRISQVSAAFARWLGTTPQSIQQRGLNISDILSSDGLSLLRASVREAGADGASMDLDVIGEDGRQVTMTLVARKLNDGGLMIAARNQLMAHPISSASAQSADARFASFFQAAPFGIATVTRDGRIASANAAFARMILDGSSGMGTAALEVLSKSATAGARDEISKALDGAMSGKPQPTPIEIVVGDDQQYSRRVYMSPVQTQGDNGEAAILYVLDATEQKALEEKFAQSSKMEAVGKLAGGIAHDFNNVLTAIIGFSDLLLQTHRPTDPAYKDIMNIRSSANRAAGLVAKLLAFSRRQTLQPEPLQLGEVVTEWVSLLKRTIGERIELKVLTGRDLWHVKTDKTQYDQVITNLTVNARDAMPDGGTLTIRTRNVSERDVQKQPHLAMPVGEYVVTEVEDTGCGMEPDVLAKIFEPFFTTKDVGKGTGLGLSTVYGIVKQSGGFIFPESTPGKGTIFRVYLPRYIPTTEDQEVSDQKAGKKDRQGDLTGTGRVLLVEDEDVVRNFAARALKRQGYEVLEADSGVAALEVMAEQEGHVDIVVSDVVMPEMDGPTLLKELRKTNPDLKIIFVSGYPNEAFENSLDPDQQFAFLPKPCSLPQLAAKVKKELAKA
ncbi:MAG: response regulator [Alphaproteobacteria bacterium]|nr:response regulator [Alphaproteobacteria bacterium]